MAHFKIKLLTSKLDGNNKSPMYLETPLSDFDEQLLNKKLNTLYNTHTYCYTFDEKISLHTNGQKTL